MKKIIIILIPGIILICISMAISINLEKKSQVKNVISQEHEVKFQETPSSSEGNDTSRKIEFENGYYLDISDYRIYTGVDSDYFP